MAEAFKGKGPAPSVPWSDRLHILNTGTQKELDYQRQLLTYKLKEKQVKVQPLKSSGSRFWPDSADIEQMHMDEVALEAHVNFLEAKDKGEVKTLEDWLAKDNNHRWSTKYLAHKQSMEINIAVSKSLDDGVLAIVPDIDLEPADLDFPLKDTEERKQRLRDWEKSEVKEYKIIVIDPSHPTLTEEKTLSFSQGIHTLLKLHGRKLRFLTDFRPRARYIWWVFLVSVTVAGWRTKTQNPDVANAIAKEIRAGIRCWGTPGTYITRNVLESFIISIGHDARSFVKGDEDQKKKKKIKPDYCALSLIAHDHAFRNIDEEDDEMDGD
ncbi:hypothetical protein CGMCC3_g4909 [Colletotrichum fructicola]|nr:uncharacterized protein CGMCC3_g4909 [Colletotrichum fructicola]KAE9579383.1 hypothetical protein CGMCC3_g4909 [Colletotrichum fructicola]